MPPRLRVTEGELAPLLARARQLAQGARRMLGIAGPPGAGKSTVAEQLVAALVPAAVLVAMDGFHLAGAELQRLGRQERKGAPDTFDAAGFVALLRRLQRAGGADAGAGTVWAPRFDRSIEEPIAGAVAVAPTVPLVVIEGNYLLLETGDWGQVRELLDEIWYLELPRTQRLQRLIDRHVAYGRSPAEAAARACGSDQRNAELISTTQQRADLIVELIPRPSPR